MNFNKNTLIRYNHACMQAGESSRFSPQLHTCFTYVKQESKLRIHKYNKACTIRIRTCNSSYVDRVYLRTYIAI